MLRHFDYFWSNIVVKRALAFNASTRIFLQRQALIERVLRLSGLGQVEDVLFHHVYLLLLVGSARQTILISATTSRLAERLFILVRHFRSCYIVLRVLIFLSVLGVLGALLV